MFGIIYSLLGLGAFTVSDLKATVREEDSKIKAKAKGEITYRDRNWKLRLIHNNHLCDEQFRDDNCPYCAFDLEKPYSDYVVTDYKTKEKYYVTRAIAQYKLIEKIKDAQERNDPTLLYLFRKEKRPRDTKKNEEIVAYRKQFPRMNEVELIDGIEGDLYINPLEVDIDTIDFAHPRETLVNNHIYMLRDVEIKVDVNDKHTPFYACYYMDSCTGLLTDIVPDQIKFEQFVKSKNEQLQDKNRCYKWFTNGELYGNMLAYNEEQIRKLDLILNESLKYKNQLNESNYNYFCEDMLKAYTSAESDMYYGITTVEIDKKYRTYLDNYVKEYVDSDFLLHKEYADDVNRRYIKL